MVAIGLRNKGIAQVFDILELFHPYDVRFSASVIFVYY